MISNMTQAAELVHRYGNVGRTADDLIKGRPNESQLESAIDRCHREVNDAERIIREYHKMESTS